MVREMEKRNNTSHEEHENSIDPYLYEYEETEDDKDCPSATRGDYSPSAPWNAPGMSIHDFI